MTEDTSMFTEFRKQKSGKLTFGDNDRGNILGIGKISKDSINASVNVYLVDGLKYNLLSISQLCDKVNRVWFDESQCATENVKSDDIVLYGSKPNNVYAISLNHICPMHLSYLQATFEEA